MEKKIQTIEETIGYLDMQSELKRLKRYEELVKFLFNDDLCPMAIMMDGKHYLMEEEEGFEIMDEYKMFGTIKDEEKYKQ